MAAKRVADKQLTDLNWNEEEESEEVRNIFHFILVRSVLGLFHITLL